MPKHTHQYLIERAALTALELFKATADKKALRIELSCMYDTFFEDNGRPEGKFHQDNDDFLPVMLFTESKYQLLQEAKKAEYKAKRRHETAIRALAATSKEAA
ncbi:hypothetical protein V2J83_24665 [Pseudomonas alliivorans]|nr:hypothetical protein [Pseudomonas alliivorans]